jgi:protein ImuB
MFACIHRRSVSDQSAGASVLVDLAFTFSPLVEQVSADTVVFDVTGQDLLFGKVGTDLRTKIAEAIIRRAGQLKIDINLSLAGNADVAIHAARCCNGVTIIKAGDELLCLGGLSIKNLDCSLVAVEAKRADDIHETLALWGVRTFRDLAGLPLTGVSERLGQEGVRLQRLAQGRTERSLRLVRPPIGFEQSLELEHPVSELEPLSFILSRLLHQLCANLNEYGFATNELRLRLGTHTAGMHLPGASDVQKERAGGVRTDERTITLPVPMRNPKTLLRLLLFEIEREPPQAPVLTVAINAEPVKPRAAQTGLFIPLAPEPEKLEITLARLAKLVGTENVGSPELLDTHRPDAIRMNKFNIANRKKAVSNPQSAMGNRHCVMGFRIFRPAWLAEVKTSNGQPVHVDARAKPFKKLSGKVSHAAGPWRGSGDWWRADVWARDEWEVAIIDSNEHTEVLCRIYRDLISERWFVAGVYD